MKKIRFILVLLGSLSLTLPAIAQTINNLSAGSSLGGTELVPMYQGSNPAVSTTTQAIANLSGLTPATGNVTLHVATTGSDSNPCSSGSPCLTVEHTLNVGAGYNYLHTYTLTVNVGNGTYAENVALPTLINYPTSVFSAATLIGNTTTQSDVTITSITSSNNPTAWNLEGVTLAAANVANSTNIALFGSWLAIDKITFSGMPNLAHIYENGNSHLVNFGSGNLTVSSSAPVFIYLFQASYAVLDNVTANITFSGSPNFSTAIYFGKGDCIFGIAGINYSGTVTGQQFQLYSYTLLDAGVVRGSMPGNSAGFQDGTSYYVYDVTGIRLIGYTVGTLPAAGIVGRRAYVTDAVTCTFLGSLTGSGSTFCPVIDNGSSWLAD